MVHRYKNDHGDMFQAAGRRWVLYEDYAELARKLRELAKQVVNSPCDWKTDELAREILDL